MVEVILVLVLGVLLETGRLLLVFIDNCELLHLVRRQVSSQAGFNLFKNLVSRELFRILENCSEFSRIFTSRSRSRSILNSLFTTSKPLQCIVSAVLFGFHGINLFKNLVSRELLRILENFHFSISISKHFDFTFHFSKKSESILISLCTSRKRVKAFFFHFALLEKE